MKKNKIHIDPSKYGTSPGDPPKKLADQVSDATNFKRFNQIYNPLKQRLRNIYGEDFKRWGTLGGTHSENIDPLNAKLLGNILYAGYSDQDINFLMSKFRTHKDGKFKRILPPVKGELKEVHDKIMGLSDKQIINLLSKDYFNLGVSDIWNIAKTLDVSISDINRYKDYFKKKKSQGYTFREGGDIVSTMGYRDDSPFRNSKSLNIYSPEGYIDMTNVSRPIMANGQRLEPNSGLNQVPPSSSGYVKETPLIAQNGGNIHQINPNLFSGKTDVTTPYISDAIQEIARPGSTTSSYNPYLFQKTEYEKNKEQKYDPVLDTNLNPVAVSENTYIPPTPLPNIKKFNAKDITKTQEKKRQYIRENERAIKLALGDDIYNKEGELDIKGISQIPDLQSKVNNALYQEAVEEEQERYDKTGALYKGANYVTSILSNPIVTIDNLLHEKDLYGNKQKV